MTPPCHLCTYFRARLRPGWLEMCVFHRAAPVEARADESRCGVSGRSFMEDDGA